MSYNTIDDGFGNCWTKCRRPGCQLEIVRPGKVQCDPCDSGEQDPIYEIPGQTDLFGNIIS